MSVGNQHLPGGFYRPLKREKVKLRFAVDLMTSADLWYQAGRELEKALQHGEKHESREAFYATCRAQLIVDELYARGQQLLLFHPGSLRAQERMYSTDA